MNKLLELYKAHKEIIRYLIVGGLTTVVSMVLYYGSIWTFLDAKDPIELQIANVLSWIGAVLFAYVTNRIFVFESKSTSVFKEFTSFVGSRVLTLLLDMGTMYVLVTVLAVNENISKIFAMVLVTVGNYVISKIFVFKKGSKK